MQALELIESCELAVPIIVVTGANFEDQAVECLEKGAMDFLLKDRMSRLGQVVVNAMELKQADGQQKPTESATLENEALHRAIVESAHDGIVIVSEGCLVFANAAFLRLCALQEQSEVVGQPEDRFIHMEDRELVKNKSKIRPGSGPGVYEYRLLTADNETRTVQASTSAISFLGQQATLRILRAIATTGRIDDSLSAWETEVAQRAHEDSVLTEIGRIISSSRDIDEVYERFAEQVNALIPFDRTLILLVDHERELLTVADQQGIVVPHRTKGATIPLAGSQTEQILRTRSSVMVQTEKRTELEDGYFQLLPAFDSGLRSFLTAPLSSKDDVIGVLQFQSKKTAAYDQRDLALAERVAGQIAGAVANSVLRAELEREVLERQALAEIGRIISSSMDINDVYEPFADQVRRIVPFDRIVICDIDVGRGVFTARYIQGISVLGMESGEPRPLQRSLVAEVAQSASGLVKCFGNAAGAQFEFPKLVNWYRAGIRCAVGVPLVSGDDVTSVLFLASATPEAYDDNTLGLVNRVGDQISGAIANSLLFTERMRAEKALADSESRFRAVFENSPIAIGLVSLDGRVIDVNGATCDLLGYKKEELVERKTTSFLHPEDAEDNDAHMHRVLIGEASSYTTEQRYITKSGSTIWGRATGSVIKDEAGETLFRMGLTEDVTERRLAERAIREGDEKFRSVVGTTSDAVISIDSAGMVVAWNPSAERVFRFDESEILGKPLAAVMPGRFFAQHDRALGQFQSRGALTLFGKTVELVGCRKDSSEFPMELSLTMWDSHEGRFFTGFVRDITECEWRRGNVPPGRLKS